MNAVKEMYTVCPECKSDLTWQDNLNSKCPCGLELNTQPLYEE